MSFFNIPISQAPTYDQDAVQPMRDELTAYGFTELLTPEDVDAAINNNPDKTVLVLINSVCGCAAGSARPGTGLALQHKVIPDHIYTAFAGQEKAAVARLRDTYLSQFPPSSPSIALFKNGEVLKMIHRRDIEGRPAREVAAILVQAFDQYCAKPGPSVPPEQFEKIVHAVACGSKIPRFQG